MARPPRADRPVRREISLPQSLSDEIDILLFSPTENRIPNGALSKFFEQLARQALDRLHTTQQE